MHDPRYLKGIEHFNRREFYDAHETWEELWHELQGEPANFVQGLIQFATALHHFEASNLKGTKILFEGGHELLAPLGESYWDLPVKKLIGDMTRCVEDVLRYDVKDLPGRYHPDKRSFPAQLKDDRVPRIRLSGEAA